MVLVIEGNSEAGFIFASIIEFINLWRSRKDASMSQKKKSSGNWLCDCDIEKRLSGHSCPPQLQPRWHKDRHGLDGFRATSGRGVLNNYCSTWPIGSMETIRKTNQDTPVLHNSNPEGIRTGIVLTGFEPILGGECQTTNVLPDPLGPLEPSGRPIRTLLSSTTPTQKA